MLVANGRTNFYVAFVAIIGIAIVRGVHDEWFVLRRTYHIFAACLSGVLTIALLIVTFRWVRRILAARRLDREWQPRKVTVLQSIGARATVMLTILLSHLVTNALVASNVAWYCSPPRVIAVLTFIRWEGWNTLLLLMVIEGHRCVLIEEPRDARSPAGERSSARAHAKGVLDLPWSWHWPKLIIWAAATGTHSDAVSLVSLAKLSMRYTCCHKQALRCGVHAVQNPRHAH